MDNGVVLDEYPLYTVFKEGYLISGLTGKKVVGSKDKYGYLTVTLYKEKGGKGKTHKLHRLVAKAFIPNPYNKPQVNHRDGNKSNPHYSNLEWVTNGENQLHAFEIGTQKQKLNHELAELIRKDDRQHKDIAKDFNISSSYVSMVKTGKRRGKKYETS